MLSRQISNWDDAYTNGIHIPDGDRWPQAWEEPAHQFRTQLVAQGRARLDLAYGDKKRNQLDLFLPEGAPHGLVVFIHGGFWTALDKSYWSHLAAGPLAHGYAVAMPSYTLCPDIRLSGIVDEIACAIAFAASKVDGPLMLTGHSAGGHLAARMACMDAPLPKPVQARIRHVVSISGLHDLRPLIHIPYNDTIRLDEEEAQAQSPALLQPCKNIRLTCWAGAAERAEFLRQNELLANIWIGLGARTLAVTEPDRHHFNIIDGLAEPDHPLTLTLLEN